VTIAQTVAWLVDRERVRDVLVRCALSQDAHDWASHGNCFEPDARYVHPTGEIDGRAAIVARSRAALEALDGSQHLVGSIEVAVDGDTAEAVSYFHSLHVREAAVGGPHYTVNGTYADTLTRRDGSWRISRRIQTYTGRSGNRDVIVRT
jgi:SnoaL-like domain